MKKRNLLLLSAILYLLFALMAKQSKAQNIGINVTGSTPNASAGLDIDFTNKGLLIPRVALTSTASASPLTTPATSVMIYNTATAGAGATAVSPGYYYWTGSAWVQVITSASGVSNIWDRTAPNVFLKNINDYVGIGINTPEEKLHLNNGNMLLDDGVIIKGRSTFSGTGTANLLKVISDDIEIGSNSGPETFKEMRLYIPHANAFTPNDGRFEIRLAGSGTPLVTMTDQGQIGFNESSPEEMMHIDGGNVLLDDGVIVKGRSTFSGTGTANLLKVISDDIEIGSNSGPETFKEIRLYIPHANAFTPNDGRFEIRLAGSGTPLVTMTDQGQIGFNESSPEEMMHIDGGNVLLDDGVIVKGRSTFSGTGTANLLKVISDDIEIGSNSGPETFKEMRLYIPHANAFSPNDGRFEMRVAGSGTPLLTATDQGKIGIKNSSPSADLDIEGTLRLADGTEGTGKILTSDASGNATWQTPSPASATAWGLLGNAGTTGGTNFIGTTDAQAMVIKTNNTERLRILQTGNVGIGTSTPNQQLEITGNFRLPASTGTTGIIYAGPNRYIHNYGASNFFAGTLAGNFTTTASSCVGIGPGSLSTLTTGSYSTAVGYISLTSLTSGQYNVAVGAEALRYNTVGPSNTAVGYAALTSNTTAGYNVAIGTNALFTQSYNNGGSWWVAHNVAIGFGALQDNQPTAITNGIENTAVGSLSLANNITGLDNAAFGYYTLLSNTTGSYNTSFGTRAGEGNGMNPNVTGNYNTFIGYQAAPGTTTALNNATAIGKNAQVSMSNALVLGGTAADAVNVGIGTTTPTERLSVTGSETTLHGKGACIGITNSAAVGTGWFLRAGAAGTTTPTGGFSIADNAGYRFSIDNAGRVGINTTTPSAILDVNGTTKIGTLGTALTNIIKTTVNVDVAPIAAGSTIMVAWTVTNAATGSTVSVSPGTSLANGLIIAYARVSAANTVEIKFTNVTGASIDPATMDYYVTIVR